MNASKIVIGLSALVIGFGLWVVLFNPTPTPVRQIQTKEEGNVDVSVTPVELTTSKPVKFDIAFNTHSVDLDFDVAKIASMTDDKGTSYGPAQWEGPPPGGHHRSGTLTFSQPTESDGTRVKLTLNNIAGISTRVFEFTLK